MKRFSERDLIGQATVDYEERVDVERLKRERLERVREQIGMAKLGGMLLYDPLNIRYVIGARSPMAYSMRAYFRYVLVPQAGPAVLFTDATEGYVGGPDIRVREGQVWDFFPCGNNVAAGARKWASQLKAEMKELGIQNEPLGVDRLDYVGFDALRSQGISLADARVPIEKARAIKTIDEIALIRQACAVADIGIAAVQEALRPGITENELWAIFSAVNIKHGGEYTDAHLLSAGGNTNPWYQAATDRLVRDGDLVALDSDMAGPMGYFADISRTYLCGDRKPSRAQDVLYRFAYEFIQETIPLFKPGMGFREIAANAPEYPEEYKANRYVVLAHGAGMSDEWPAIYFPDVSWSGFGNDDDVLKENMVICVEALVGMEGGRESVKLEEQLLVTSDGPEVISLAPFDWRFL